MQLPNMSLPSEELLLAIINRKFKQNFTLSDYYFGQRKTTSLHDCESVIPLHAKPGSLYTGTARAFYNRIRLDVFLEGYPLLVPWRKFFDTDDLIPTIYEQLGINLERYDVVSDILDPDALTTKIRISNRSLTYSGHIPVMFIGHPNSLSSRVSKRLLSGFNLKQIKGV